MQFWQLVKSVNGKQVIKALPPPNREDQTEDVSEVELDRIMRERPVGEVKHG